MDFLRWQTVNALELVADRLSELMTGSRLAKWLDNHAVQLCILHFLAIYSMQLLRTYECSMSMFLGCFVILHSVVASIMSFKWPQGNVYCTVHERRVARLLTLASLPFATCSAWSIRLLRSFDSVLYPVPQTVPSISKSCLTFLLWHSRRLGTLLGNATTDPTPLLVALAHSHVSLISELSAERTAKSGHHLEELFKILTKVHVIDQLSRTCMSSLIQLTNAFQMRIRSNLILLRLFLVVTMSKVAKSLVRETGRNMSKQSLSFICTTSRCLGRNITTGKDRLKAYLTSATSRSSRAARIFLERTAWIVLFSFGLLIWALLMVKLYESALQSICFCWVNLDNIVETSLVVRRELTSLLGTLVRAVKSSSHNLASSKLYRHVDRIHHRNMQILSSIARYLYAETWSPQTATFTRAFVYGLGYNILILMAYIVIVSVAEDGIKKSRGRIISHIRRACDRKLLLARCAATTAPLVIQLKRFKESTDEERTQYASETRRLSERVAELEELLKLQECEEVLRKTEHFVDNNLKDRPSFITELVYGLQTARLDLESNEVTSAASTQENEPNNSFAEKCASKDLNFSKFLEENLDILRLAALPSFSSSSSESTMTSDLSRSLSTDDHEACNIRKSLEEELGTIELKRSNLKGSAEANVRNERGGLTPEPF